MFTLLPLRNALTKPTFGLTARFMSYNANMSKNTTENRVRYDMRSDTVTKPTQNMFTHMLTTANVGDDVYGEDISINNLEKRMAQMTGKEAGVFCTSGTLSNQLGFRSHLTQPPYSVLCDINAHVHVYEASGIAFHSRASTNTVKPKNDKYITLDEVKEYYVPDDEDVHCAPTRIFSLENTINGVIHDFAKENSIVMHLDGARLWNASAKTGIPLSEYGKYFDSMSICFSKGMGAPVGSILLGTTKLIKKARHFRKLFGGGWRQAGFLAEAANYTIDNHFQLLKDDHRRAEKLHDEFAKLGMTFAHPVETNMVFANFGSVGINVFELAEALEKNGILIMPYSDSVARLVFHHQIDDNAAEEILSIVKGMIKA
ncbi:hypothetical protein BB559_004899 [Furculomyces boomerangus]|uniref:Aromatic amino acid beta-eliminating lyase/threonine aldolase domain-containing protein n=2 Tax=Harpellales TaxID=61421 RepID=A0A2T9YBY3_9FUNG|nr:hypothetical protein BB559_004899 [Furculomyces boomerangus]PWA03269.1 hypothetical protein BB558_000590 [Smittium angustum]